MAQIVVAEIVFELDLLHEVIADLGAIHQALAYRHGDRYRDLDRQIEIWLEGPIRTEEFTVEWLKGDGVRGVMVPPPSAFAIIRRARELGL